MPATIAHHAVYVLFTAAELSSNDPGLLAGPETVIITIKMRIRKIYHKCK